MGAGTLGALSRRPPFPGASFELSALTLSIGGASRTGDANDTVGVIRRAFQAGITTFDTAESVDPGFAETALARAFPEGDPRVVVLSSLSAPSPGPSSPPTMRPPTRRTTRPGRPPAPATSVPLRRLYEVEAADLSRTRAGGQGSEELTAAEEPGPLVVRCRSPDDIDRVGSLPPPWILSGPFSLLERTLPAAAALRLGPDAFRWIVRDPFAGGRLDGSRFVGGPGGPQSGLPRSLLDLEAEFGPVARLGFLARPRQRTLAQAALHFVADPPWVVTVCLSAPAPERWEEIVTYPSTPALSDEELKRLAALPFGGRLSPATDRGRA